MGVRLAGNQNAAIFDDFWQSRTPTYWTYFKREFDKKGVNIGVLAGFVLLLAGIICDIKTAWLFSRAVLLKNCRIKRQFIFCFGVESVYLLKKLPFKMLPTVSARQPFSPIIE